MLSTDMHSVITRKCYEGVDFYHTMDVWYLAAKMEKICGGSLKLYKLDFSSPGDSLSTTVDLQFLRYIVDVPFYSIQADM